MVDSSEAQWVADAIEGDTDAFGRLVRTHTSAVCAITLAITRDPGSSEEVAQDVFLLAWTRLPQLKNPDSFGPWLRQLSRNRSREFLRASGRRARRTRLDNAAVDRAIAPTTPVSRVLDAEERQVVAEALEALPDETREVLVLYYREGRSVRQVAALLGLSEAAVRKRLSRARGRLRDEVEDRFEGVLLRTIPGAALVVGVLAQLPPRGGAGLAGLTLGAGAAVTVGLAIVVGAGALWWSSGSVEEPSVGTPEGVEARPPGRTPDILATGTPAAPEVEDEDVEGGSEEAERPAALVRFEGHGHVMNPVFSPDGKYLAFEVNRLAGAVDLFVSEVDADGAGPGRRITLPGGSAFEGNDRVAANPAWHPQGILVFEGSNQSGRYRLYYHQPSGGQAAEMISSSEVPGHLTFPTISADGSAMAFVVRDGGSGDLWSRETSTGKLTRVTTTAAAERFPTFSSDNRVLLFARKDGGDDDILTQALDGPEVPVAEGPGDQTRPAFAGDERILYFDGARGEGRWDLASFDRIVGEARTIARDVRLPHRARPAVSPDDAWVAWTSSDPERNDVVMLSRVDGSETVEVPTEKMACGEPALGLVDGRVMLAYTALKQAGADWRRLYLVDVTDRLR